MRKTDKPRLDFDHWAELARSDPAAFEREREAVLRRFIDAAPEPMRKRLEGLQWRVDRIRDQSNNPLGACIRLSNMMWDSVIGPNGLLESLDALASAADGDRLPRRPKATVLELDAWRRGAEEDP